MMALPSAAPDRELKHRRSIDVQIYARGAGVWEVDARLLDVRTQDARLLDGVRRAGEPLHDMLLRLVVDAQCNILEAGAQTNAAPYTGTCEHHGDAYARLVGLNLLKGFRQAVRQRLGGVLGCTHLTEMAQVLPTAVVQALAGELLDRGGADNDEQPFQIDRCHALRADGEIVRLQHPRWFRKPAAAPAATPASRNPSSKTEQESPL